MAPSNSVSFVSAIPSASAVSTREGQPVANHSARGRQNNLVPNLTGKTAGRICKFDPGLLEVDACAGLEAQCGIAAERVVVVGPQLVESVLRPHHRCGGKDGPTESHRRGKHTIVQRLEGCKREPRAMLLADEPIEIRRRYYRRIVGLLKIVEFDVLGPRIEEEKRIRPLQVFAVLTDDPNQPPIRDVRLDSWSVASKRANPSSRTSHSH